MRRGRRSAEAGFTLVELLVAATILVLGLFGLATSVVTSHQLSDLSEHETVASQTADHELDFALTVPYTSLALTSLPTAGAPRDDSTQWNNWLASSIVPNPASAFACSSASSSNNDPTLPNDERSTSCVVACPAVDATSGCPVAGTLAPVSTLSVPTTTGTARMVKIYRFVTWVNDLACGANCPNPAASAYKGDYKRVTIAVLPVVGATATSGAASTQSLGGQTRPVVVSAIRNDPTLGAQNAAGQGPSPCDVVQC